MVSAAACLARSSRRSYLAVIPGPEAWPTSLEKIDRSTPRSSSVEMYAYPPYTPTDVSNGLLGRGLLLHGFLLLPELGTLS
jgi:hypothetical protein